MWRPNLTGIWALNVSESEINFSGIDTRFKIIHHEPRFELEITHFNLSDGRETTGTISLSADAKPYRCLVAEKMYWATLKWRWNHLRLVLKTATNTPDTYSMVFRVSADRCTLFCDHQQTYGNLKVRNRMTFDRKQEDELSLVGAAV